MAKSVEDAGDNITADVAALREDIARLTETVGSLLKSGTQGAGQRVSEAVDDAKTKFASTAADVQSRVAEAGGEIEGRIGRNPMTAMAISFGVGMVLGMITRPRR